VRDREEDPMPEDKDFKRVVRARMAKTGERYTAARAELRPEPKGDAAPPEPVPIPGVVATDKAELEAWRRERWQGAAQQSTAPRPLWEITLDVGGSVDVLHPPAVEFSAVAALGRALGGVGYASLGLHLDLGAPEGTDPDDPRPSAQAQHSLMEDLRRTDATFRRQLGEHLGTEMPAASEFLTGRVRRLDGEVVVPARSGATILVSDSDTHSGGLERLDLSTWDGLPGGCLGRPWAAFGVVLRLQRDFPVQQFPTNPPANFSGPWQALPDVDDEFWEPLGRSLKLTASRAGLPDWPLHQGRLHDIATRSGRMKNWQMPV
jgi:hypothetical protein